ncbi:MAG: DUF1996 domain-containing protein [Xanthomonadales bacterium]|nr:DUF1996 domain-containing protein [Xanthomonadales bacterium]
MKCLWILPGCLLLLTASPARAQSGPATVLVHAPASTSSDDYARFEFSAGAVQGYECALDDAAFAPCSSPHTLLALDRGSHHLAVRAYTLDGQRGPAVTHTWTVASVYAGANSDLIPTTQQPAAAAPNSWRGIFRINCAFAHSAYDDPIVFPGQAYAAHQHSFYGFLGISYASTIESLYAAEDVHDGHVSSCQGNRVNRSAYWVPTLLAPLYSNGVRALDERGQPAWTVVPAVVGNDEEAHEVFYYSAGIDDLSAIQPIPTGLRMIAGDMRVMPGGTPQSSSVVRWHCQSWNSSDAGNPRWSATIPECVAPDRLRFDIFFPSCWNGVDLDSADHKSHLAYPVTVGQTTLCPDTHPVPILRVSYHYAFGVRPENADPTTRSSRGWRLASDMYTVTATDAGGLSLHGDWMNGWHHEVLQTVLDSCVKRGLDCHDGNLANGYRLSGTTDGRGDLPDVIAEGLGPKHMTTAAPTRGLWWDRSRPGHGFDLQRADDQYALILYTYGGDGAPLWYLGTAAMLGQAFAPELHRYDYALTRAPRQRSLPDSATLLTLRFDNAASHPSCRDGTDRSDASELAVLDLVIDQRRVSWCVEPIQYAQAAAQPDYTGLWFSPDDAGWGLSLATGANPGAVVAATVLYAYDNDGQGRWLIGSTQATAAGLLPAIELTGFSGPCPGCPTTPLQSFAAGTLQLHLSDSAAASSIDVHALMRATDATRWARQATPISRLSD